jgi:hypothetical protein
MRVRPSTWIALGLAALLTGGCDDTLPGTPDARVGVDSRPGTDSGVDGAVPDGPTLPPDGPTLPPDGPTLPPDAAPPVDLAPPDACVPTAEVCDGKDNNCNNQIDETFTDKGKPCSEGIGACQANGVYICASSQQSVVCDAKPLPAGSEACRDNVDNDCDKTKDEICGPLHSYAVVSSTGKALAARGFSVAYLGKGLYELTPSGMISGCTDPLLVSGVGGAPPHVVKCQSTGRYRISFDGPIGAIDHAFHAVRPGKVGLEAWASIDNTSCTGGKCILSASSGKPVVFLASSTGVFEISHPSCSDVNQPVFATLRGGKTGYALGQSLGTGKCLVRTFTSSGALERRPFSFWLPDTKANAWAAGSEIGKVLDSNDFNDQNAKWSLSRQDSIVGAFLRFSASFEAWSKNSAALVASRLKAKAIGTALTTTTTGVQLVTIDTSLFPPQPAPTSFYVIFVQ